MRPGSSGRGQDGGAYPEQGEEGRRGTAARLPPAPGWPDPARRVLRPAGFVGVGATPRRPPSQRGRLRPIEWPIRARIIASRLGGLFNPAIAANAAIPVSSGPNPRRRLCFTAGTPIDRLRSLDCLAQAIYFEARSESEEGQRRGRPGA